MKKIAFLLFVFLVAYSSAQDSLKLIELETFAITSVRAAEQAPIPKTTMKKKEIDELYVGQHPIFLLENSTPGLFSYSESGTSLANYGQIRLRGISQERINFTLNGVPLNDMIDQGVFFSNFTDISSNFESIQVQRGVGTSSNGVSSYGGSVNFESLNITDKDAFTRITLGGGSFETGRASFQHSTGVNEKGWGFMTNFSGLTSAGFKDNAYTNATSYLMTGGYYGEKDVLKITFFTARSENGLAYSTIEESILDTNRTFNNLSKNDYDDFQQFLGQLQYTRNVSEYWTVGATAYYGGASGDFFTFGLNYPLRNDHLGSMVNAEYEKEKLSLNLGVHGYSFLRENEESLLTDLANPFYNESSQKNEVSAFAKANYQLNKTTFYADVQFRTAELNIAPDYTAIGIQPEGNINYSWTFINPRAGVTHRFTDEFSAYASFGRSGREPTKVDLFGGFRLDSNNYNQVRQERLFSDEYVNDFEAGIRYADNKLNIDANYYFMSFENEIAPNGAVLDFGVGARRNIPSSRRSGFELAWIYLPNDFIEFTGNVGYLTTLVQDLVVDSTVVSNNQHILSPDWIVNTQIKLKPVSYLAVSLSGRYIGEQYMTLPNDDAFTIPSSFVTDLSVEYEISKRFMASVFLNNALDANYYTFGLPTDNDFDGNSEPGFFVQAPRNIFVNLTINL